MLGRLPASLGTVRLRFPAATFTPLRTRLNAMAKLGGHKIGQSTETKEIAWGAGSDWTLNKTKAEVEERYIGIGARRAHQGVPFSQFLYAIHATKENLWDFMQQEGLLEPGDLINQMELLRAMEPFFDRALYFASIGHESVMHNKFIRAQVAEPPPLH